MLLYDKLFEFVTLQTLAKQKIISNTISSIRLELIPLKYLINGHSLLDSQPYYSLIIYLHLLSIDLSMNRSPSLSVCTLLLINGAEVPTYAGSHPRHGRRGNHMASFSLSTTDMLFSINLRPAGEHSSHLPFGLWKGCELACSRREGGFSTCSQRAGK